MSAWFRKSDHRADWAERKIKLTDKTTGQPVIRIDPSLDDRTGPPYLQTLTREEIEHLAGE